MGRRATWPPIYPKINASGSTSFQVDLGVIDGQRVRKSFTSKSEAERFAEQKRIERKNEGMAGLAIPLELRVEAAKCAGRLAEYGSTITEATDYYINRVLRFRCSPPIGKVADALVAELKSLGRRPRTIATAKSFVKLFARHFDGHKLTDVTRDEVEELAWYETDSARTAKNRITLARQVFNFGIRRGWADSNPANLIPVPSQPDRNPGVLTVDQVRVVLRKSPKWGLLGYVTLGLFAGIRRCELVRMDWSAVHLSDSQIVIDASVATTRSRRVITIDDVLHRWLSCCAKPQGSIITEQRLEKVFKKFRQDVGIEDWPRNAMRHSFASYHLAKFKNVELTAFQMGHRGGTESLDQNYKALVSFADAERYWALRPEDVLPDFGWDGSGTRIGC